MPERRLRSAHSVPLENLLVIYDDLDLPLGRVRLRPGGGSGGHKGMRSIIEQLGTEAFSRLRVGIGRPPGRMDAAEYVLQPFDQAENAIITEIIEQAVAAIECWLLGGIVSTMDKFNRPIPTLESTSQENQE